MTDQTINQKTNLNESNEIKIITENKSVDIHIPLLEQLKKASEGNYGVIIIVFIILLIFIFYKSPIKQN
jgi:hypothetical protein